MVRSMQKWGKRYPEAGYGGKFYYWLYERDPQPYNSWGNGSAMRLSSVGWLFDTLEEMLAAAVDTAVVTHNHPEGIKGAEKARPESSGRPGMGKRGPRRPPFRLIESFIWNHGFSRAQNSEKPD